MCIWRLAKARKYSAYSAQALPCAGRVLASGADGTRISCFAHRKKVSTKCSGRTDQYSPVAKAVEHQ